MSQIDDILKQWNKDLKKEKRKAYNRAIMALENAGIKEQFKDYCVNKCNNAIYKQLEEAVLRIDKEFAEYAKNRLYVYFYDLYVKFCSLEGYVIYVRLKDICLEEMSK